MHEIMLKSENINNQNYVQEKKICDDIDLKNQNNSDESS